MRVRNAMIGTLAVLLAGPLWAQTRPAAPRTANDAPAKIAVINVQAAIGATEEGKQAAEQFQTKFAPRVNEINDLSKQIQGIQQKAQDGANTLSDQAKARLAQQYQLLSREYQRKQQELQGDEQDAQSDVLANLGPKMYKVIDQYAGQHGYSVVLDYSPQASSPVIYFATAVNITSEIVKLYDQTYPVKKPAAAKPKPKPKP